MFILLIKSELELRGMGAGEQYNGKMRTNQNLFAGGQECVLISWAPGSKKLQAPKLISNTF